MNELHFSANGLGVVLKTKHGGLSFTTEEFGYYQNLFTIADSHSLGKLAATGAQIKCMLVRSDAPWALIEKVLSVALKHRAEGEDSDIYFYQWLIICKLIAFYQETKRAVNDKVFKSLHTTKIRIPFADFHLSEARHTFAAGSYYEKFRVQVGSWVLAGEGFQDQHVKFRIETNSTLVNKSEIPHLPASIDAASSSGTTNGSGNGNGASHEKYLVERRYSEFETLAAMLQKNYKSVVVPPLPIKNWNILAPSETIANQRSIEFQMFLNDLVTHPVLKHAFELRCYLECSSQGLKSFVDLYSHIQDGKLNFSASATSAHVNELVTKLLSDSAAAVTSSATALFSSMWDTVRKNVPMLATPPVTRPPSNEHDVAFTKTLFFLEGVLNVGRKLETIVTQEQSYQQELAKIAQCCKNMAEFETMPELTRVLNICHASMGAISRTQLQYLDTQHMHAQIPAVYMGRYKESYQLVLTQRSKTEDEQQTAIRAEIAAQLNVDRAHAALVALGQSPSAYGAALLTNGHAPYAPSTPTSNGHSNGNSNGNGKTPVTSPSSAITTAASSTTSPVAAAPGAGMPGTVQSPAEVKIQAAERAFNQAKLDLAAAEDHVEQKRAAAEQMNASLRAESVRLENLERAQLMKCAKEFVLARMEAARSNVKAWEELKLELENTGS